MKAKNCLHLMLLSSLNYFAISTLEVCMSKFSFISIFAIVISVTVYNFVTTEELTDNSKTVFSTGSDTVGDKKQNNFDQIVSKFQNQQHIGQEQLKLAFVQQTQLLKALKKIEARLDSLETHSEQSLSKTSNIKNSEMSDNDYINPLKKNKTPTIIEADLGNWMDTSLTESDATATSLAFEQAAETFSENPALNLDGMECAERFCRATITINNDDPEALRNLFGQPPFMNEGFTIHDADGRVQVYFTQPGVSIGDLRGEALESIRNM